MSRVAQGHADSPDGLPTTAEEMTPEVRARLGYAHLGPKQALKQLNRRRQLAKEEAAREAKRAEKRRKHEERLAAQVGKAASGGKTALDRVFDALDGKPRFGAVWVITHMPGDLPPGWENPDRLVPLVLRCTATVDADAFVERIGPHVHLRHGLRICEVDSIPHAVAAVSPKFLRKLGEAKSAADLFYRFNGCFSEWLVKELWYDVWLEWHNSVAKRAVRIACRARRSLGPAHNPYKTESVRQAAPKSIY